LPHRKKPRQVKLKNAGKCDAWKQTKMREFHGNCGKLGRSVYLSKNLKSLKVRLI
jgi:hypothetical protein